MKAAVAVTWAFTVLFLSAAAAEALKALDQPKMLGAVSATPETMWPVEERLTLPYVPGVADNAPSCAPTNAKPLPEVAKVSAAEAKDQPIRRRKHSRHGHQPVIGLGVRGGDELAAAPKGARHGAIMSSHRALHPKKLKSLQR